MRLLQDAKSVIDAPQRVQRLELAKVLQRSFHLGLLSKHIPHMCSRYTP